MKVWVVLMGLDYEGYDEPKAVFDTQEKAKEFLAKQEDWAGVYWDYFEMEVE